MPERKPPTSRGPDPAPGRRKPPPKSASRRKRERRREQAMRALSQPRRRSRAFWAYGATGGVVILGLIIALVVVLTGRSNTPAPGTPSPSITPVAALLASVSSSVTGQTIDGIQCEANEQIAYHIHAHLAIYLNNQARTVPYGIGIPAPNQVVQTDEGPYVETGKCFYWLHTHTEDGIIHIESPTQKLYTLGDFFDIWQQPLSDTQVGPDSGTVIVYVNGTRYTGNPRAITLTPHELIQLDVNSTTAPQPFTFPAGL